MKYSLVLKRCLQFPLGRSRNNLLNGILIGLASVLTASCSSNGGERLVSSHMSYNDSVQLTITREVLSNIVRSRYGDPMQFLSVQSINAQFSVSGTVSAGAAGIGGSATSGDVGASIETGVSRIPHRRHGRVPDVNRSSADPHGS